MISFHIKFSLWTMWSLQTAKYKRIDIKSILFYDNICSKILKWITTALICTFHKICSNENVQKILLREHFRPILSKNTVKYTMSYCFWKSLPLMSVPSIHPYIHPSISMHQACWTAHTGREQRPSTARNATTLRINSSPITYKLCSKSSGYNLAILCSCASWKVLLLASRPPACVV